MLENLILVQQHLGIVDGLILCPEPKGNRCAGQFIRAWMINKKECWFVISVIKPRPTTRNIGLKNREHFSRVARVQQIIHWHVIVSIQIRRTSSFKIESRLQWNVDNMTRTILSRSNLCLRSSNFFLTGRGW